MKLTYIPPALTRPDLLSGQVSQFGTKLGIWADLAACVTIGYSV